MALVSIDDHLHRTLKSEAGRARTSVDAAIDARLQRFLHVAPADRAVVLSGQPLQDLELLLGGGPLASAEDLLARIHARAGLSFGHIRLAFSHAQLAELQLRAEKTNRSVEELVRELVSQIERDLFWTPRETV